MSTSTYINCIPSSISVSDIHPRRLAPRQCREELLPLEQYHSLVQAVEDHSPLHVMTLSSEVVRYDKDTSAGNPTITGSYGGDSGYYTSDGTFQIGVTRATSTVGVSRSPASVTAGLSTTCTATVTGSSPTGSISGFQQARLESSPRLLGTFSSETCHVTYRR